MNRPLPPGVETVLLDAGNTLISMDYDWIRHELAALGHAVGVAGLERAEAAARPATSGYVARQAKQSGVDSFLYYFARILERVPELSRLGGTEYVEVVARVTRKLKRPGADHRLWSVALPGVREALETLSESGLTLVVVSNSDGSVERALDALNLTRYLDAVLDSEVVGYEKPDRRFFDHALDVAGAEPQTTLHVGDMYYQDVVGARSAGIECVLLDPYDDWADVDCIRRRSLRALAGELVLGTRRGEQGSAR